MAEKLIGTGCPVIGYDKCEKTRQSFSGPTQSSVQEALNGANLVITMLPNGADVREILLTKDNFEVTSSDCVFVDMSSSSPFDTVKLGESLSGRGGLLDAPVSGGVKRAREGSLSMMVGGPRNVYSQHEKLFKSLASKIFYCGDLGSGHTLKGLNNYVSAAGLVASCEALIAAEKFGIAPDLLIDVLNNSTGKNDATQNKLKRFVTSKKFNSGFSLTLQAKDLQNAVACSEELGLNLSGLITFSEILNSAKDYFDFDADHTEIYKYLKNINK